MSFHPDHKNCRAEFVLDSPLPTQIAHEERAKDWRKGLPERICIKKAITTIGRGDEDSVKVKIDSQWKLHLVSRRHAELVVGIDGKETWRYLIRDLQSTNGVAVNKTRVKLAVLKDNDLVTLGGCGQYAINADVPNIMLHSDIHYRFFGNPNPPSEKEIQAARVKRAKHKAAKAQKKAQSEENKEKSEKVQSTTDTRNGDENNTDTRNGNKRPREDDNDSDDKDKEYHDNSKIDVTNVLHTKRPKQVVHSRFKVGDSVECKSLNVETGEVDAWFDAHVLAFNSHTQTYRVNFDGYDHRFDEDLGHARVRKRSRGEWTIDEVTPGKTMMLCQYRQRMLWYDVNVIKILNDPAVVGDKVPCLRVQWVENPYIKKSELDTPFDAPLEILFLPEQKPHN